MAPEVGRRSRVGGGPTPATFLAAGCLLVVACAVGSPEESGELGQGLGGSERLSCSEAVGSKRTASVPATIPAPILAYGAHAYVPDRDAYVEAIDQFVVECSARYVPRDCSTFCNIFMWDVSVVLGFEIPHWIWASTKRPATIADGAVEMPINSTIDWLTRYEGDEAFHGWTRLSTPETLVRGPYDAERCVFGDDMASQLPSLPTYETTLSLGEVAQRLANTGVPVIVAWRNDADGNCQFDTGPGHVAWVVPDEDEGLYDEALGPRIAQAGTRNLGLDDVHHVAHGFFSLDADPSPLGEDCDVAGAAHPTWEALRYYAPAALLPDVLPSPVQTAQPERRAQRWPHPDRPGREPM